MLVFHKEIKSIIEKAYQDLEHTYKELKSTQEKILGQDSQAGEERKLPLIVKRG